jgi:2-polyprenyl-3-methyl-5-hydroxy-6-metoxy-1,4-benzoquinol methylase
VKYVKFDTNRILEEATAIYKQRIEDAKIVFRKFSEHFIYRNCPICNEDDYERKKRFLNMYEVAECKRCNSQYINPTPNEEALKYYYNHCLNNALSEELIRKRHKKSFINDERIIFLKPYITSMLKEKKTLNILEVGCNNGTFLATLKEYLNSFEHGCKVNLYGIDIDANAINNCIDEELNLQVLPAEKLKELNIFFDLVLHFELIEHLIDPSSFMKNLYNVMSEKALMVFTTPNALGLETKALDYDHTRLLAHSVFPPMHLNAFSTQNILLFAYKHNFGLKHVETPGGLDMDMISILKDELEDEHLKKMCEYDEEIKAYMQYLLRYLNGSSHMRVVLQKI